MILFAEGFEAYGPDHLTRIVERDLAFTLERMNELTRIVRSDPPGYKLGNGKDGVMYVDGNRRLMAFAGPHTREGLSDA